MRMLKRFLALSALLLIASPALADNCTGQNGDVTLSVFAAAHASTVNSQDQINCKVRGVMVVVDLTTMTTATVTVTIQGKDVASGKYYTLLASAAKVATGTTLLVVYPGSTAATNVDANYPLPRTWRISTAIADNSGTASVTGTVGASVLN